MIRIAVVLIAGSLTLFAASAPAQTLPPKSPAGIQAAYTRCMELARRAPNDAIAEAEKLYKLGAQIPSRHCLGAAFLTLGRPLQAAKVFFDLARDMIDGDATERAEAYGQAGRAWLEADDLANAERAFAEALKIAPNDVLRLIDRAILRGAQGKDFEALDDLNRAIELAPAMMDARILRAAAERRVGAFELAEEDIDAALAIDAQSPAAWLEKGLLAQSRKQWDAARAAFVRAAEIDPGSPSGLTAAQALRRLGPDSRRR